MALAGAGDVSGVAGVPCESFGVVGARAVFALCRRWFSLAFIFPGILKLVVSFRISAKASSSSSCQKENFYETAILY